MVQDFSLQHGPIGTLFRSPRSPAEWDSHRLSDRQLDFYRENGYLAGVRLFTDDQVEILQRVLHPASLAAVEGNQEEGRPEEMDRLRPDGGIWQSQAPARKPPRRGISIRYSTMVRPPPEGWNLRTARNDGGVCGCTPAAMPVPSIARPRSVRSRMRTGPRPVTDPAARSVTACARRASGLPCTSMDPVCDAEAGSACAMRTGILRGSTWSTGAR